MSVEELDLPALDAQLLAALHAGDQAAQMKLYRLLGEHRLQQGLVDESCFLLTNAWVLALSLGDSAEHELHDLLAEYGRVPR